MDLIQQMLSCFHVSIATDLLCFPSWLPWSLINAQPLTLPPAYQRFNYYTYAAFFFYWNSCIFWLCAKETKFALKWINHYTDISITSPQSLDGSNIIHSMSLHDVRLHLLDALPSSPTHTMTFKLPLLFLLQMFNQRLTSLIYERKKNSTDTGFQQLR